MGRKITQEEIDKLAEWNKTHKYVSVEAYQDLLDWIPEGSNPENPELLRLLQEEAKE